MNIKNIFIKFYGMKRILSRDTSFAINYSKIVWEL